MNRIAAVLSAALLALLATACAMPPMSEERRQRLEDYFRDCDMARPGALPFRCER